MLQSAEDRITKKTEIFRTLYRTQARDTNPETYLSDMNLTSD